MFKSLHSSALAKRHQKILEQVNELHADIYTAMAEVDESIDKLQQERTELAKLHGRVQ